MSTQTLDQDGPVNLVIVVINDDGQKNIFTHQNPDQVDIVSLAVSSGRGFYLADNHGATVYAPGSVKRVAFKDVAEEKDIKDA